MAIWCGMAFCVRDLARHRPEPVERGLAAIIATLGVLVCDSVVILFLGWSAVLLPLCIAAGVLPQYRRFVLAVVLPISIALFAVWGWIVGAPPGHLPGSAPQEGFAYAALISLRLATVGGIWQVTFLTLCVDELPRTLSAWGVRGGLLVVVLGAVALAPEMRLRAEQVATAREARGLVPNRRIWTRAFEFPRLLRPLLAWTLRSAIQRPEVWRERNLLARLTENETHVRGERGLKVLLIVSVAWFACSAGAVLWW